jgi:hypothetical protein
LRAVLPLARIIRGLTGRRGSPPPAVAAAGPLPAATIAPAGVGVAPPDVTVPPAVATVATPVDAPQRSLGKRVVMRVYGLFRPVLRPLAWRSRSFLTGELRSDVARLELRIQQLGGIGQVPGVAGNLSMVEAELKQFSKMLETTLVTLALDQERPKPSE